MTTSEIKNIVYGAIRDNCESVDIEESDELIADLSMDSIDILETGLAIERELEFELGKDIPLSIEEHLFYSSTVKDLVNYVTEKVSFYTNL